MKNKLFLFLLLITISTFFLGIGYAVVDNITLNLEGTTNIKISDKLEITDVVYKSSTNADKDLSKIISFNQTTINSKVTLGNFDDSEISYTINLKNNSKDTYKYVDTVHSDSTEFYDNNDIDYTITGIKKDDKMIPDSEKDVTLTFKYKDKKVDNNILNSFLNIKFVKVYNIEYVNIEDKDLINSIEENKSASIEFKNPPDNVTVTGTLDYNYKNGILSLSNVKSDLKITGIKEEKETTVYKVSGSGKKIGSVINPDDYSSNLDDITGTYMKYTIDENNKVTKVEICKTETDNSKKVCLISSDKDKYSDNKDIITKYFNGSSENLPKECSEEENLGATELTCSNSYVVLAADSDGGVFINDIENKKSCVINPNFGIYSCK